VLRGAPAALGAHTEVVVVDDDLGGPYAAPSREPFLEVLRAGAVDPTVVDAASASATTPLVIALFGDIRAWKGRPGYSASAVAAVDAACAAAAAQGREAIVVQFGHPRLATAVASAKTVVCAWGGERVMQQAAARWLLAARKP
jgi:hypothetical protein